MRRRVARKTDGRRLRNRRRTFGKVPRRAGFAIDELKKAIREATRERKIFPILYGSALRQIGIAQLLDAVIDYLPSPLDEGEVEGKNPGTGEVAKRKQDPNAPFSAYRF